MSNATRRYAVGEHVQCPECNTDCWVEDSDGGPVLVPDRSSEEGLREQVTYLRPMEKDFESILDKFALFYSEGDFRMTDLEPLLDEVLELRRKYGFNEEEQPEGD